jgi:hypothetical protein
MLVIISYVDSNLPELSLEHRKPNTTIYIVCRLVKVANTYNVAFLLRTEYLIFNWFVKLDLRIPLWDI